MRDSQKNSLWTKIKSDKIYLFLTVLSILILVFLILAPLKGSYQHELFFYSGDDFFADYSNVIDYTKAKNVYTGDGQELPQCGPGARAERAYPPLAYLPAIYVNHIAASHPSPANNNLPKVFGLLGAAIVTAFLAMALNNYLKFGSVVKTWFTASILLSGIYLYTLERSLQTELPGLRGFSEGNIKKMRIFFEEWSPFLNRSSVSNDLEKTGNSQLVIDGERMKFENDK